MVYRLHVLLPQADHALCDSMGWMALVAGLALRPETHGGDTGDDLLLGHKHRIGGSDLVLGLLWRGRGKDGGDIGI